MQTNKVTTSSLRSISMYQNIDVFKSNGDTAAKIVSGFTANAQHTEVVNIRGTSMSVFGINDTPARLSRIIRS